MRNNLYITNQSSNQKVMEKLSLSNRLEQIRIHFGMKKQDFAQKIGIHPISYGRYSCGHREPNAYTMQKIEEAFPEVNTKWLFTGEGFMLNNANNSNTSVYSYLELMQRIEIVRKEKGLTKAKFADKLGISHTTYSKYITGQTTPTFVFINSISSTFPDVDQNWLISGEKSVTEITPDVEEQLRQHHSETEVELLKVVATLRSVIEDQAATINALRTQLEVYKSNIK